MYFVVVTGNIGAGKSTLINAIKQYLTQKRINFTVIYEYLDDPEEGAEGAEMLQRWLDTVSGKQIPNKLNTRQFEEFIISYYEKVFTRENIRSQEVIVMERSPLEIPMIFLDKHEKCWTEIMGRVKDLMMQYDIPGLEGNFSICKVRNISTLASAISMITETLEIDMRRTANRGCFFFVDVAPEICLERIKTRGRSKEDSYDLKYLEVLRDNYVSLWEFMKSQPRVETVLDS